MATAEARLEAVSTLRSVVRCSSELLNQLQVVVPPLDDTSATTSPSTLWLRGAKLLEPHTRKLLPLLWESLAVLSVLAQVNRSVWRSLIRELWPTRDVYVWTESDTRTWRMGVELDPVKYVHQLDVLQERLLDDTGMRSCAQHPSCVLAAASELLPDEEISCWAKIPICITLRGDLDAVRITKRLQRMLKMVKALERTLYMERLVRYVVQEVAVHGARQLLATVDDLGLDYLAKLARHGVVVRCLPQMDVTITEDNLKETVSAVRTLLGLDHTSCGVKEVTVNYEFSWVLLSALRASPSVRIAHVDPKAPPCFFDIPQHQYWRLIALALFSRLASPTVEEVILNLDRLDDIAVDEVCETVGAVNPIAQATGLGDPGSEDIIELSTSRFFLREPLNDKVECSNPLAIFCSPQPIQVPAITMHAGIWTVLLPGRGKVWVNDLDVKFVRRNQVARRPLPSMRALSISMTSSSLDATGSLLSHIAQTTKCLRIVYYDGGKPIDRWLRTLIFNCRYLEELVFSDRVMCSVLDSYHEFNSTCCKLRKLAFPVFCRPGPNMVHLEPFLRSLSLEPSSGFAVDVKELALTLVIELITPVNELIDILLKLLEQNRRLAKISYIFKIDLPTDVQQLRRGIEHVFGKYIQDEPTLRTARITRSQRRAFLSVVRTGYSDLHPQLRPLGQMSSDVIPRIFSYAGDRVVRRFELCFS